MRKGFINARGQVTKLIGESAEPEPQDETGAGTDGDAEEGEGAKFSE